MRQAIPLGPGGTSDALGNLTITYGNVPTGQTWIGTISIPGAPASALIVAQVGNISYGTWSGSNTFGPVTVGQSDNLELTITNLLPNTPYQPAWNGVVYTNEEGPLVWPSANSSTTGVYYPFVPVGIYTTVSAASQYFDVTIQGSWRSLYIAGIASDIFGNSSTPVVTGNQSGYQYSVFSDGATTGASALYWHVPLLPVGIDQTVRVTYSNVNTVKPIYYGGDYQPAEQAVYFAQTPTINVAQPVQVTGGSTTAIETYTVGGVSAAVVTLTNNTATQILAAPAAGTRYRLHLATISGNGATSIAVKFYDAATTFVELHMGSENQQLLDGMIVNSAIYVQSYSTSANVGCHLRYDTIATPTIT
jgi:hypothetical protein